MKILTLPALSALLFSASHPANPLPEAKHHIAGHHNKHFHKFD